MSLISKVKTLKQNSDYRISDVLFMRGLRWEHSGQAVLTKPCYENSILRQYLTENEGNKTNLPFFVDCTKQFKERNDSDVPSEDEIVLHLRMGDVAGEPWFKRSTAPYLEATKSKIAAIAESGSVSKITIVTCFAYQVWSDDSIHLKPAHVPTYSYSDEKQDLNIRVLSQIIESLQSDFDVNIDIRSSENPDDDVVYCTYAKHYIEDLRHPGNGGFTRLLKQLNQLNK